MGQGPEKKEQCRRGLCGKVQSPPGFRTDVRLPEQQRCACSRIEDLGGGPQRVRRRPRFDAQKIPAR